MGEEPIDATTDRRTFPSGLLGLNVGSFLPRQWWFGVEERVHVESVRRDLRFAGAFNLSSAIEVGDDFAMGYNQRAESTLEVAVINGEFGPDDDPNYSSIPPVTTDILAHHPEAGYYAVGVTDRDDPTDGYATYLRQWRPESDSSWIRRLSVFDFDDHYAKLIPRAMKTTDDGGVVVAGESYFWEVDKPDDEEAEIDDSEHPSTPTPSTGESSTDTGGTAGNSTTQTRTTPTETSTESTPTPAETTTSDDSGVSETGDSQQEFPLPEIDFDAGRRQLASWVVKYGPTGDLEWKFGRGGQFEYLTTSTDRPRILVSTFDRLVQLSFDESGAVTNVETNERYGDFGREDMYVGGAFDRVGDTYRCVVDMGEPTPEFLQFDDDLNIVDQTRAALLSKPKGRFLFADEDGYLFRRTGSKLGVERPVIEKYGLDGRPRWSHAPTAFDGVPGVIKLDDGYGLIGPRDGRIRYAALAEGAPIQFWALLVTAAVGIKRIASGVRGGGDDDD